MIYYQNAASLLGAVVVFSSYALAQSSPRCPLLGPVFPPPENVLKESKAVPDALSRLNTTLQQFDSNGTFSGLNASFYFQVFSKTDTIFEYGLVPPSTADYLTSGTLDEDTIFRIGSVSKLLTVYTLLAEAGMRHVHDPVTTWVPELQAAVNEYQGPPSQKVRWDEVTIGELAGHLAGIKRDCMKPTSYPF
jgi:hypothetical protein